MRKPFLQAIGLRREGISDPDAYPFGLPAVASLNRLEFNPDVTFLVGENGTGVFGYRVGLGNLVSMI